MGTGASSHTVSKGEPQTSQTPNKTSNISEAKNILASGTQSEEKANYVEMNAPSNLTEADRNTDELKRHLSEGSLARKEVVTCCVELLKFSFTIDETEEIQATSEEFVLKKDIPHVVCEIYTSLLTNYPTLVSFDREKDEVSEFMKMYKRNF